MPCNSEHMEPRFHEKESKLVAELICYALKALGRIPSTDVVKASKAFYGDESMVHEYTKFLCEICTGMTSKQQDQIIYDGRNADARRLADWWEAHKKADAERESPFTKHITTDPDCRVSYEETDEIKQKVFDQLILWYAKHGAYNGESIMQCDDPQIDAAPILAHLADKVIKFNVEYVEE